MTAADHGPLDPAIVAALYLEHGEALRRFLTGVTRDAALAQDVVQTTFAKLAELGSKTQTESRKAWLFRVAFHEALEARRRVQRTDGLLRRFATESMSAAAPPVANLLRQERIEAVRQALAELPPEQLEVVRLRIYEERSFAQIAEQLRIPLGTALGRMRLALHKLQTRLRATNDERES